MAAAVAAALSSERSLPGAALSLGVASSTRMSCVRGRRELWHSSRETLGGSGQLPPAAILSQQILSFYDGFRDVPSRSTNSGIVSWSSLGSGPLRSPS